MTLSKIVHEQLDPQNCNKFYETTKEFVGFYDWVPKGTILRSFTLAEEREFKDKFSQSKHYWIEEANEVSYVAIETLMKHGETQSNAYVVYPNRPPHPSTTNKIMLFGTPFKNNYTTLTEFVKKTGLQTVLTDKLKKIDKITGIFEAKQTVRETTYDELPNSIKPYYDVIAMLPEYFDKLKCQRYEAYENEEASVEFEFERIAPVARGENDRHVGERWQFTVYDIEGQPNMGNANVGDNDEIYNVNDVVTYCAMPEDSVTPGWDAQAAPFSQNIWRTLIFKDPSYADQCPEWIYQSWPAHDWKNMLHKHPMLRLHCPEEMLTQLGLHRQIRDMKRLGVLESKSDVLSKYLKLVHDLGYETEKIEHHKSVIGESETLNFVRDGEPLALSYDIDDDVLTLWFSNMDSSKIVSFENFVNLVSCDPYQSWFKLLSTDATYAAQCPEDYLQKIKPKLSQIKRHGILESLDDEKLYDLNPVLMPYYDALCDLPVFKKVHGVSDSLYFNYGGKKYDLRIAKKELSIVQDDKKLGRISSKVDSLQSVFLFVISVSGKRQLYGPEERLKANKMWRELLDKNGSHAALCPTEVLKTLGKKKLASIKDLGVLESATDLHPALAQYFDAITWYVEMFHGYDFCKKTTRFDSRCFVFGLNKNERTITNECKMFKGFDANGPDANKDWELPCVKFDVLTGEYNTIKDLKDFIDKCAQDLASHVSLDKMRFSTPQFNAIAAIAKDEYLRNMWAAYLSHDVSELSNCPTNIVTDDFLKMIGRPKLAVHKNIGTLDESVSYDETLRRLLELYRTYATHSLTYDIVLRGLNGIDSSLVNRTLNNLIDEGLIKAEKTETVGNDDNASLKSVHLKIDPVYLKTGSKKLSDVNSKSGVFEGKKIDNGFGHFVDVDVARDEILRLLVDKFDMLYRDIAEALNKNRDYKKSYPMGAIQPVLDALVEEGAVEHDGACYWLSKVYRETGSKKLSDANRRIGVFENFDKK